MQEAQATEGAKEDTKGEGQKKQSREGNGEGNRNIPQIPTGSRGEIFEVGGRTMAKGEGNGRQTKKGGQRARHANASHAGAVYTAQTSVQ